jgi:hypothetical protein
MKWLILALALLTFPATADAARFCFFVCPHYARHHIHHQVTTDTPATVSVGGDSRYCLGIKDAWRKAGPLSDKEKFIQAFPATRQDAVRKCLGSN